jgi:hypothetical protein
MGAVHPVPRRRRGRGRAGPAGGRWPGTRRPAPGGRRPAAWAAHARPPPGRPGQRRCRLGIPMIAKPSGCCHPLKASRYARDPRRAPRRRAEPAARLGISMIAKPSGRAARLGFRHAGWRDAGPPAVVRGRCSGTWGRSGTFATRPLCNLSDIHDRCRRGAGAGAAEDALQQNGAGETGVRAARWRAPVTARARPGGAPRSATKTPSMTYDALY